MNNLFGMMPDDYQRVAQALGEPAFRGRQLTEWVYDHKVNALSECKNLPKKFREKLSEDYGIFHGEIIKTQRDPEDGTRKYLIRFPDGQCVETVLMDYKHGHSLCISSQVGCAMGCAFCASTQGGRIRDLTAGEMLDQIYLAERDADVRVANVVVMGMGEPLQNFDNLLKFIDLANLWGIGQRKITVSTCGLIPRMLDLAERDLQINLAVSLHSVFQERREEIMPIAKRYSIKELLKVCKKYFDMTHRRVTFEYALIADFNDRQADIDEICRLFQGEPVHFNLIGLNPVTESVYKGSENVNFFCEALKKRHINCTIRRKIGGNIDAACGQLRKSALLSE